MMKYLVRNLHNFYNYRSLLLEFVKVEFKLKYRRSVLGIIWSVLQPLMMMVILSMVFSKLFARDIENFAVYVLTGRIIFDLFSQSTSGSMMSIIGNAGLIRKVYIPKYLFPVAKCLNVLVQTGFSILALLIVMFFTGVDFNFKMLLFPIPIIYTSLFSVGVSLFLSAYSVSFRDLTHIYQIFLTALMYFSAIFYPVDILPSQYQIILKLNPIFWMLNYFRKIVLYNQLPTMTDNFVCVGIIIVTIIFGAFIFYKKQDGFIHYL